MDLQFQKTVCSCLDTLVCEVQNTEQTQELRLGEGMPDVGRVLAAWAQPVLRSKEWRDDSITINGGILAWVLYAPEDGTEARCLDAWLPFQMQWDLPEGTAEGHIRVRMLPRFADARSISARKLMVRAGVAVMVQVCVPMEAALYSEDQLPEDVELLRTRYPVRLQKEAGEKSFLMDEVLTFPGSLPLPEKLLSQTIRPEITDQRVLGDKVVFRGNGNLHILYRSEEGQLHSWDFPMPFSQFAELRGSYSTDAKADLALCPTSLETELDDEGQLRVKCGLAGQYLVAEEQLLEVIEDAYSPGRELELEKGTVRLPVVQEPGRENLYAEQTIPADANLAADIRFLPDFPRQYSSEEGIHMEFPGMFQVLYYDENSALQGATARWEGKHTVPGDDSTSVSAVPLPAPDPQLSLSEGSIQLKSELPMAIYSTVQKEIPMVSGLKLSQEQTPDPGRPSLILCRVGRERLWDIAKSAGSTVDAIRKANGFEEEPAPGQMLLIPVS